jgi:hypothetical protein
MKTLALILALILFVVGLTTYFSYHRESSIQEQSLSATSSESTMGWATYSGEDWQIMYPAGFIATKLPITGSEIIRFKNPNQNSSIIVNNAPLSQRDPVLINSQLVNVGLLNEVLEVEKKNYANSGEIATSSITTIGTLNVVQFATLDTSEPTQPQYSIKTTFVKGNNLIDVTLNVESTIPTQTEMNEYNEMLQTFKFQ